MATAAELATLLVRLDAVENSQRDEIKRIKAAENRAAAAEARAHAAMARAVATEDRAKAATGTR